MLIKFARAVLPLCLFVTRLCIAQDSPQFTACNKKAITQLDINVCASDEFKRADTELNRAYQDLLALAKSDANAVAKIRTAERAWLAYRDAYIQAMYPAPNKQAEYGSMYAMEAALLMTTLTRHQTQAVKELSKQYRGDH